MTIPVISNEVRDLFSTAIFEEAREGHEGFYRRAEKDFSLAVAMTEHAVYFREMRIPVLHPLYKLPARGKWCEQLPTARNCSPDAPQRNPRFLICAKTRSVSNLE
jgi:hypothetical protein